ncbi:MAG: hypothetical protein AAF490_20245 [Chloroflexota bacterium]
MIASVALLFFFSLLAVQLPKLIALRSYRDELIGGEEAYQRVQKERSGEWKRGLILFGSLFVFLPLFIAIPIFNPLIFIFPVAQALIQGIFGVRDQIIDLSRGAFFPDKYIAGELARKLAVFQIFVVIFIVVLCYALVGDFRIDL